MAIIWGVTYTLLKSALSSLTPGEIAFTRFLIASIFFIPVVLMIREKYSLREIIRLGVLALSGVLLYTILFINGENGLSAGNAAFIVSLEPIFIIGLGIALKTDKPTKMLIAGFTISTIGLIVLLQPHNFKIAQIWYVVLILLSALSWGIYTVLGKDILEKHNPINVTGYVSIIGTFMLVPFGGMATITVFSHASMNLILSLLFIGFLGTFLGYFLWNDGLKYVTPTIAGSTLYLTPFITVLTASILISEPISIWTVVGGALLIAGVAVSKIRLPERGSAN